MDLTSDSENKRWKCHIAISSPPVILNAQIINGIATDVLLMEVHLSLPSCSSALWDRGPSQAKEIGFRKVKIRGEMGEITQVNTRSCLIRSKSFCI